MALRGKPGSPGMGKLVMPSEYISFSPWFLELHCGDTAHSLSLLSPSGRGQLGGVTSLSQGPNNPSAWSHKHKLKACIYLLQLLQTLGNVEGDVDERTVSLVLEHEHTPQTHTETSGSELSDCERSKLRHVEGLTATLRGMCVCVCVSSPTFIS